MAPSLVKGSFSRHKLHIEAKFKMKNWAQLYIFACDELWDLSNLKAQLGCVFS